MKRRISHMALGAALSVTLFGVLASSSSADTAVMGSTLAGDYDNPGFSISAPTVSAQISFDPVTSPNPVVSPANGMITGWKVKSADDGATYTLKVLRPTGAVSLVAMADSNFTGITSVKAPSAVPAGTATGSPTGKIFSYPASLPISKGDYVGMLASGTVTNLPQHTTSGLGKNLIANNFSGLPADGATAPLKADQQHDLLLQATIKFCNVPNVVGQAQAAATAAIAAGDCTSTATTQKLQLKVIKKNFSKKKRKRIKASNNALKAQNGLVLSQSPPPGTTAAPAGPPVALTVGEVVKPPKKKKKKH
jgi:hypothetical protein